FARRQRAQRSAFKSLALIPVPSSLGSLFGGGGGAAVGTAGAAGATVGTGLAVKTAAAVTATLVIGAGSYEGVRHAPWKSKHAPAVKPKPAQGGVKVAPSRGSSTFDHKARGPFQGDQADVAKATVATKGPRGKGASAERAHPGRKDKAGASGHAS